MAEKDSTRQDARVHEPVDTHVDEHVDEHVHGDTGEKVGEGVGGVSGVVAGAAIGTVGGPLGVIIGGIAGAVGGWWAGREIGHTADDYDDVHDADYRERFNATPLEQRGRFHSYDEARPVYQLGYLAARNPEYAGRRFEDVEPDLQHGWDRDIEARFGAWNAVRDSVRNAYVSGAGARMAHSDMEVVREPITLGDALTKLDHALPGRAAADDRADLSNDLIDDITDHPDKQHRS